ncbi:hypothetical protein FB45DRAFT_909653 [Roridomyces roridus]|uniref:DUF6593 domain-containing protein n=1 Tax=Roridomyces roridus TaxID=1738132 RepID=A0AAD7BZA0_9AGAR|nr:hypothetical protein FB45DRAFT_909653 [Roridomyces roridus]
MATLRLLTYFLLGTLPTVPDKAKLPRSRNYVVTISSFLPAPPCSSMEASFDNKTNILNARIRATHDNSVIYTLRTTFGYRGRKDTILHDENPAPGAASSAVGAIHWQEKTLEIYGHKKSCAEVRRRTGRFFFNRTRHWKWGEGRKEYEILYEHEEWKATLDHNMKVAARFSVPFRPHLFSKSQPALLHLTKTALAEDEVFLILVFVYCEAKRQDRTVSVSPSIHPWSDNA